MNYYAPSSLGPIPTQSQIWVALTEWAVRPIPACTSPIGARAGAVGAGLHAGDFPGLGGPAKRGLCAGMAGHFAGRAGRVAGLAGLFCHHADSIAQFCGPRGLFLVWSMRSGCGPVLSLLI